MPNLGVIPSPRDERDYLVAAIMPTITLPEEIRLDYKIFSIRNQGFFPTCVAKSGAGILSAYFQVDLSSLFIYGLCKTMDGIPDLPGTYPRVAFKVMQKYGACLSKTLPYDLMTEPTPKISPALFMEAAGYKLSMYARARNLVDIKQALANGFFLKAVILVGDNFMFHMGDSVIGLPTGEIYGYHAVILCGSNDRLKALRIANSYGKERWGENGFAWLSYDYLQNINLLPEAWVAEKVIEGYQDRIFRLKKKLKGVFEMETKFWFYEYWWAALIAVAVPVLNHFFALGLSTGTLVSIIIPILAIVFGHSWKTVQIARMNVRLAELGHFLAGKTVKKV